MKTFRPRRHHGFMNLGCLGYLITLALLIGGGQGIYTALKNRAPLEITVSDYLAKRPEGEWVTFKDATLNLLESAHMERLGKITEVFIPVQPGETKEGAPVHILMSTKDDEILAAMTDMNAAGDSEQKVLEAAARNASKLFMKRDVSGLIQFGIDSDSKTRAKLEKLDMNLAKDFVILEEGKEPALGASAAMFLGGLVLGIFMLRRSGGTEAPQAPPPAPNLPPRA